MGEIKALGFIKWPWLSKHLEKGKDTADTIAVGLGLKEKEPWDGGLVPGKNGESARADYGIDFSEMDPDQADMIKDQLEPVLDHVADLERRIAEAKDGGDHRTADTLQRELDGCKRELTDLKFQIETKVNFSHIAIGLTMGAFLGPIAGIAMNSAFSGEEFRYNQAVKTLGEGRLSEAPGSSSGSSTGGAGGTASGKTGAAASSGSVESSAVYEELSAMSDDELVHMMQTDTQGFFEKMKDLPPEDRQMFFQRAQQHLQQINQMFSMMSNLMKSMHDTQKAVINNMRV